MTEQSLPCPNCNTNIPFDPKQLLMGVQYSCPNCDTKIALSQEPGQTAQDTLNKFEKLKENTSSNKSS